MEEERHRSYLTPRDRDREMSHQSTSAFFSVLNSFLFEGKLNLDENSIYLILYACCLIITSGKSVYTLML